MKKSVLKPLFGITAAGLLLAGCSPTAGTAAEVGGVKIADSAVDAVIDDCSEPLQLGEEGAARRTVALTLGAGEVARQSEELQAALPGQEILDESLAQMPQEVRDSEACVSFLEDSLNFNGALGTLQGTMQPEAFNQLVSDTFGMIELNPRYGRIVERDGQMVQEQGSLSEPVLDASGQQMP